MVALVATLASAGSLIVAAPLLGVAPQFLPELTAGRLAGAFSWFVGPLEFVWTFLRVGRSLFDALVRVAATPEVAAVALACAFVSWVAVRSLGYLLDSRSMTHAV